MKISVFGIGYVGAVSAACLARDGNTVVATDVNPDKVAAILAAESPIVEPGLSDLIAAAVRQGRLTATSDAHEAVTHSALSFLCVGTPSRPNGSLETQYVVRVAEEIGAALAHKDTFHSVVMRSTILPGTMDELIIPTLEKFSGKRAGVDFGVAYYPEFLREGSALLDYDQPGAIVFGARDDATLAKLRELHAHINVHPQVMEIRAAETVKYINNAWHALKISFANEIGLLCKSLRVDSHRVMATLCADQKLNISPAYLTPGFAFGGSCLPKDLNALRYRGRAADVPTPVLDAALQANENQLRKAYEMVEAAGRRRVGLIGLSFKPDTDDLRYSPFVELAERLIGRGYQLRIYDPIVRLSRLTGANKTYVSEHLPHIAELLLENIDDLIGHSETIIIGNRREATKVAEKLGANGRVVLDLVRMQPDMRSEGNYHGLCW